MFYVISKQIRILNKKYAPVIRMKHANKIYRPPCTKYFENKMFTFHFD